MAAKKTKSKKPKKAPVRRASGSKTAPKKPKVGSKKAPVRKVSRSKTILKKPKIASKRQTVSKRSAAADPTAVIFREIKAISGIFADNQKMLASMKSMISVLTDTMQYMDRHSRQIGLLDAESRRIHSKLQQMQQVSDSAKVSVQSSKEMERRITAIEKDVDFVRAGETVSECLKISKDTSQITSRLSQMADDKSSSDAMTKIKGAIESNKTVLKEIADMLHGHVREGEKSKTDGAASEAYEKISSISREISGLREQLRSVSDAQKTEQIMEHMGTISSKAEVLMGVPAELLQMQSRLDSIDEKISNDPDEVRQGSGLLDYHASVKMISESKYGSADDLRTMAEHTGEILRSKDVDAKYASNAARWGLSKILECADRWEVRFSETIAMAKVVLGKDALKDAIRIKQVKDMYGVRAAEETNALLGKS